MSREQQTLLEADGHNPVAVRTEGKALWRDCYRNGSPEERQAVRRWRAEHEGRTRGRLGISRRHPRAVSLDILTGSFCVFISSHVRAFMLIFPGLQETHRGATAESQGQVWTAACPGPPLGPGVPEHCYSRPRGRSLSESSHWPCAPDHFPSSSLVVFLVCSEEPERKDV